MSHLSCRCWGSNTRAKYILGLAIRSVLPSCSAFVYTTTTCQYMWFLSYIHVIHLLLAKVDIMIPPFIDVLTLLGKNTRGPKCDMGEGLVIEMDGKSHFETYSSRPLGPTAMKRRHILGLDYRLVALTVTDYDKNLPRDAKRKVLADAIANAVCLWSVEYQPAHDHHITLMACSLL